MLNLSVVRCHFFFLICFTLCKSLKIRASAKYKRVHVFFRFLQLFLLYFWNLYFPLIVQPSEGSWVFSVYCISISKMLMLLPYFNNLTKECKSIIYSQYLYIFSACKISENAYDDGWKFPGLVISNVYTRGQTRSKDSCFPATLVYASYLFIFVCVWALNVILQMTALVNRACGHFSMPAVSGLTTTIYSLKNLLWVEKCSQDLQELICIATSFSFSFNFRQHVSRHSVKDICAS